jgi:hypothetical protein
MCSVVAILLALLLSLSCATLYRRSHVITDRQQRRARGSTYGDELLLLVNLGKHCSVFVLEVETAELCNRNDVRRPQ